ncbi:TetR/AcrR family transcriptional regulator [Niabella sp. CJ426]|uniref:TetR/AcrR family transcriptional regulator n=1 Tax=Niabella sp. CJ426 TaxID=3393740 RepID=UPI003CFBF66F
MLASKKKILKKALILFSEYGPRTTTMDDVAASSGVSKKTLYKHFENKADLIETLYRRLLSHVEIKIRQVLDEADDAVAEFLSVSRLILKFSAFFPPAVIRQLKQDNVEVYSELHLFRTQFLPVTLSYNIERGKGCGLYKEDVNSNIIAHLSLSQLMAYNKDITLLGHQHSGKDVQQQLVACLLYGITTHQGEDLANQHLNQYSTTVQV